jgi:hypothetical protein
MSTRFGLIVLNESRDKIYGRKEGGKCRRRLSVQQPPFGGIRAHLLTGGESRGRLRDRQGTGRLGDRG